MRFGGLVSSSNAIEADEIEVRPGGWRTLLAEGLLVLDNMYRLINLLRLCSIVTVMRQGPLLHRCAACNSAAATSTCTCADAVDDLHLPQVEVDVDIVWTTELQLH